MSAHQIWAADPHRFGPGKRHLIDDENDARTLCGKHLEATPGKIEESGYATCKICLNAVINRKECAQRREEWERDHAAREKQRLADIEDRRRRYAQYRQTPKWWRIRSLVIQRANGVCEGCASAPATLAHHLTYEHVGDEFLWELKAVCQQCHNKAHPEHHRQ